MLAVAVVAGGVGVEDHRQRPQTLLRAVVGAAGPQVVVEEVAEERRPVVVEHPVDRHLVGVPAARGERLELGAGRLVVCQLRFARELLGAGRRPVAAVDGAPDAGRARRCCRVRAGVEVPRVVDRPQLVGRDELLQARERRDVFVVALLGGRAAGRAVASGRTSSSAVASCTGPPSGCRPSALTVAASVDRGDGVDDRVLPVQVGQDVVILGQHLRRGHCRRCRWPTRTPTRAMRSIWICDRRLSRATRLSSSSHWAHFSHWLQHIQPYITGMPISSAVSMQMVAGELALQPNHVQPEVLHVPQDGGLAVRVVREQQVGRVGRTAHQEVPAVDLQIEVAAACPVRDTARRRRGTAGRCGCRSAVRSASLTRSYWRNSRCRS